MMVVDVEGPGKGLTVVVVVMGVDIPGELSKIVVDVEGPGNGLTVVVVVMGLDIPGELSKIVVEVMGMLVEFTTLVIFEETSTVEVVMLVIAPVLVLVGVRMDVVLGTLLVESTVDVLVILLVDVPQIGRAHV